VYSISLFVKYGYYIYSADPEARPGTLLSGAIKVCKNALLPPREPQPPQRSGKGSSYCSFRYLDNWRLLNIFFALACGAGPAEEGIWW
jgi:hypothetical protein